MGLQIRAFMESEDHNDEIRNSLIQSGYTDEDIQRLEHLRTSFMEVKELNESRGKTVLLGSSQADSRFSIRDSESTHMPYGRKSDPSEQDESKKTEIEIENAADETMDFVNMISNGFNDIMDLGFKLQDRVTPSSQIFKGEEPLDEAKLNSSGIFSKIHDNDYIQSELSRITFLHHNGSQIQEANLRNSKIKIDTFPAEYDLEGRNLL